MSDFQEEQQEETPEVDEDHPVLKAILNTTRPIVVGCTCESWIRWWGRGSFGIICLPKKVGTQQMQTPMGLMEVDRLGKPIPKTFFFNGDRGNQIVVLPDPKNLSRATIRVEFCPFCGTKLSLDKVYRVDVTPMKFEGSKDDANIQ